MTREGAIVILANWQAHMQACEQQMELFRKLSGSAPEAPLPAAISRLMTEFTRAVAAHLGGGYCAEWLEAWWTEHDFGAKPMRAAVGDEPLREISTIEQLVGIMFDDGAVDAAEARNG